MDGPETEFPTQAAIAPGTAGCSSLRIGNKGRSATLVGLFVFCFCFCNQPSALAEPLDLSDPRPREISVSFEISPREQPGQTDTTYSQGFRAFVEPGLRASEVRVVIPSHVVEEFLLGDQRPIRGSFSDFVWRFDVRTGDVVSASLNGRVRPRLDWGFMKTDTRAELEIEMGTARTGGFKAPLRVLGQLVFRHCTGVADASCHLVEAARYDRSTGYVNAVGQVWVHSSIVDLWNFSPLGEAIFSEATPVPARFANGESEVEFSAKGRAAKLSLASGTPGVDR